MAPQAKMSQMPREVSRALQKLSTVVKINRKMDVQLLCGISDDHLSETLWLSGALLCLRFQQQKAQLLPQI